jgi:glycerol uptake facilitator-like aquaporin
MEGLGLDLFMISACTFGTLLEHPSPPLHRSIPNPFIRRVLMGMAMGTTAISLIYWPFGKRSGAHINPSTTFTFFRLGKIETIDALFYMMLQFAGGVKGVMLARAILGNHIAHPAVNYVATVPGRYGAFWAFAAEMFITFLLMAVIRLASFGGPRADSFLARLTLRLTLLPEADRWRKDETETLDRIGLCHSAPARLGSISSRATVLEPHCLRKLS